MNKEHAAIHEAGHAVMQWFVGWGADLEFIKIRVKGADKSVWESPGYMKALEPCVKSKSSACSRLLVLYAGNAVSNNHFGKEMYDIDGDWNLIQKAVGLHFAPETATPVGGTVTRFREDYAQALNHRAINITCEIVKNDLFMETVRAVASRLIDQEPDHESWCKLSGHAILEICEHRIGYDNRQIEEEWKDCVVG